MQPKHVLLPRRRNSPAKTQGTPPCSRPCAPGGIPAVAPRQRRPSTSGTEAIPRSRRSRSQPRGAVGFAAASAAASSCRGRSTGGRAPSSTVGAFPRGADGAGRRDSDRRRRFVDQLRRIPPRAGEGPAVRSNRGSGPLSSPDTLQIGSCAYACRKAASDVSVDYLPSFPNHLPAKSRNRLRRI